MKHLRKFNENIREDNSDDSFTVDGKTFYKANDDDWINWYNWDSLDELYIVYNGVSGDVEKVDATYFRDNFVEDDWEKVGNLEVADCCEVSTGITDYIITRVK